MIVGGLYDWNPFLIPLLLALGAFFVFGPCKPQFLRCLPYFQARITRTLERMHDYLVAYRPGRCHRYATLLAVAILASFVYLEWYYRFSDCAVSAR